MKINEIHVFLRGGLGNQLFQYALGLHVSITQDKKLVIREDLLPESEDEIGGVSRWPNQISHFQHSGNNFTKSHQPSSDTNLFGKLMQAQRMLGDSVPGLLLRLGIYGAETSGLLIDDFLARNLRTINGYAVSKSFALAQKVSISKQVNAIKKPSRTFETLDFEIRAKSPIIVHLRMGDYLSLTEVYGSISIKFIQEGLAALSGLDRPPIWIFTQNEDDLGKDLLETINPERVVDSKVLNRPIENMLLMSKGGGLICSNSTLSWWSAFLSGKSQNVIAPRYEGKTNVFNSEMTLDSWRVLGVDS
jgi:hypothetical protein